ncbi:hypothetical protein DH2020_016679 [Rehmannia glutinosa]|uniref:DNA topoisomerase 2 n=1 Tax=Rehmannia glutinosa TaxID=99300 RepID=A0ABR0WPT6_REHGL
MAASGINTQPLQISNQNSNIPNNPQSKTIEETYQKRTQHHHILLRPDTYIGSIVKSTQNLWVYEGDKMVNRNVTYVPGLYKIFDEILVNAADNKQRDPKMDVLELLTSSNYDDSTKKTTGGRNGFGAKLTNIFSNEFIVELCDAKRKKKYRRESWTRISFKPDLAKFQMGHLEADVVALMKKRVIDVAGCLGETLKVVLNGKEVPIRSFSDYVDLYLESRFGEKKDSIPRFVKRINYRWEICVCVRDTHFEQVSFVNAIATMKGGTHVDYVTDQLIDYVKNGEVSKENPNIIVRPNLVKNNFWVFVNALIDNPTFNSQTKLTLTTSPANFGSSCELEVDFLEKGEITGISKLEDANEAGCTRAKDCTLILTEGDSAKALAMAGISAVGRDCYGVFPLRGKLLNVREANNYQISGNEEIQSIMKILRLEYGKNYNSVESLRYGHVMIMTDQGLGTSTSKEGKEYFQDLEKHKKDFLWLDKKDNDAIELAFSKHKIQARKKWLQKYEPGTYLDQKEKHIKYSDFVDKELIQFSVADLKRSIPSMVDGFKPGQRKILFSCFKRNFIKEAKVAQLSGYVSEHSAYHHGEQSLANTIVGMAQDYMGSNNINLLQPNGQFGTRHQGGKDHASARYIYTCLSPITRFLFNKNDDALLHYLNEDGQSVEPTWYVPVIPMVLVNGTEELEQDFREFNDDKTVHFEIYMSAKNLAMAKEEGLIEKFKLSTTISTSNMHLFKPKGVLAKYSSPEKIIEEFCDLRLEFYEKRKIFMLSMLELELLKLENKVRFIDEVIQGKIILMNRKRSDLLDELKQKNFTPFPRNATTTPTPSEPTENEYEYLLSMPIGTLTMEKVQELCAQRKKLNVEVDGLRHATPKSLWLKDLDSLEQKLNLQSKIYDMPEKRLEVNAEISKRPKRTMRKKQESSEKKANNKDGLAEKHTVPSDCTGKVPEAVELEGITTGRDEISTPNPPSLDVNEDRGLEQKEEQPKQSSSPDTSREPKMSVLQVPPEDNTRRNSADNLNAPIIEISDTEVDCENKQQTAETVIEISDSEVVCEDEVPNTRINNPSGDEKLEDQIASTVESGMTSVDKTSQENKNRHVMITRKRANMSRQNGATSLANGSSGSVLKAVENIMETDLLIPKTAIQEFDLFNVLFTMH